MDTVHVALLQLTSSDDIDENVACVLAMIDESAANGAEFILTPETTHLMEMNRSKVLAKTFAESEDPGLNAFRAAAKGHKVWLLIGSLIINLGNDRLANRSFLIAPDGSVKERYDKIHLFDVDLGGGESYRESALYEAGTQAVMAETPFGGVGMSVCYDLRFPYLYRQYGEAGAKIVTIPAAFTEQTGAAHWHTLLRARAIETGCFVLAPAQTGKHATTRSTYGHSLIVSPWGEIISDGGNEVGITYANLELANCDKARQTVPSLKHTKNVELKKLCQD